MFDVNDGFYDGLTPVRNFADLADPACFFPVPDDWVVGVSDIVNSTAEIAAGRYKTVNMVGAAVISAISNALGNQPFPYVFGGDGAGFAVPLSICGKIQEVLAGLRRWALEEFGMDLRAALVPVAEIRAQGCDVRVARFAASAGVDYAMFAGQGMAWAETQMKTGNFMVDLAAPGALPDLTGLSCRWSNSPSKNGQILSLVVKPTGSTSEREFSDLAQHLVNLCEGLERAGHPMPVNGPDVRWPPPGLDLDARVSRGKRWLTLQKLVLLAQNFLIWMMFYTGKRLGEFDPTHYARAVSANSDFRKFDDGLKMTLDCDADTRAEIEQLLDSSRALGKVRFGIHTQDEAMMTCFVPSAMREDHVHFVDGAAGGYTRAAANMR